jgi:Holliday junction resolvasome RuvABC DNA-binding subunit
MIVELKDNLLTVAGDGSQGKPMERESQLMQDAVSALVNLGYRKAEAENNVRAVMKTGEASLEAVLKESLRRLGRQN